MTTTKKMLCKVKTYFLFKNKACNPICSFQTKYMSIILRDYLKGILNIVSDVKYHFCYFDNM